MSEQAHISAAHHDPFVAHQFDDRAQQTEAVSLGMWAFLVQEILFFGGLFYLAAALPGSSAIVGSTSTNRVRVSFIAAFTSAPAREKMSET